MVRDKEMKERIKFYILGYIVGYLVILAYNNFKVLNISPINVASLAFGFLFGTAIYYGIKPGGFYKYSIVMLKQFIACMSIFIVAVVFFNILKNSFNINFRFFVGI